jgi:predicted metal-binding membrane protein
VSLRRASAVYDRPEQVRRTILLGGILLTGALWLAMWLAHSEHVAGPGHSAGVSPSLTAAGGSALLWMVMMAAMMTPAALPWLGVLASIPRSAPSSAGAAGQGAVREGPTGLAGPCLSASFLLLGYLTVWGLFSVAAAASQMLLVQLALLEPHALRLNGRAAGGVLLFAGLWEVSPIKEACLRRCRSPFGALLADWASGPASGYRIGLRQGLNCLGCCWGLMALAFVVGLVSLVWMAALTAVVCAEKLLPRGHLLPRLLGVTLACWGVALLASPG